MRATTQAIAASLIVFSLCAACSDDENDEAPSTPSPVVAPATPPETDPVAETSETPGPPSTPSADIDEKLACARHHECRLLVGVCGGPAPSNATSVEAMQRQIEALARITTCGVQHIGVEDMTPACIDGACTALLGPRVERRCAADSDCVVTDGPCGATTEAVRREARAAFDARVDALQSQSAGCGYRERPEVTTALCDDGLCVGRADEL